jgi:hypothetical protein
MKYKIIKQLVINPLLCNLGSLFLEAVRQFNLSAFYTLHFSTLSMTGCLLLLHSVVLVMAVGYRSAIHAFSQLNMSILFAFFFRKIRHPTKTHL